MTIFTVVHNVAPTPEHKKKETCAVTSSPLKVVLSLHSLWVVSATGWTKVIWLSIKANFCQSASPGELSRCLITVAPHSDNSVARRIRVRSPQLRNNHQRAWRATSCEKAPWVIKVLITLHIFMDTIKNKTAIKKIADCRAKSPKDPISSWSTWWTHWQADCFPVPIFGACEKWSVQPVCGLRWVINLVLSLPWW